MNSNEAIKADPARYRRWTPEEDAQLRELVLAGKSLDEIAAATGRTRGSVSSRRGVLQVKLVYRKPYKRTAPWTQEEIELLKTMFHSGASQQEIVKALGRTPNKIRLKCRDMRLLWFTIPWGDQTPPLLKKKAGRPRSISRKGPEER